MQIVTYKESGEGGSPALDFFEYIGSFGGPDKGLGLLIVLRNIILDGGGEFLDAAKHTAANPFGGEITEESLDHVQPGGGGGGEMDVESLVALEPSFHLGVLVGGVVVYDEVDLFVVGSLALDQT